MSLTINVQEVTNGNLSANNTVNSKFEIKIKNWDSKISDVYLENFDIVKLLEIESRLDTLLDKGDISEHSINDIVSNVCSQPG